MRLTTYLTVLAILSLGAALSAETEAVQREPERLAIQVEQAQRQPDLDLRLRQLAQIGSDLDLESIAKALDIAARIPSLRERLALQEAALIRWSALAPAEAFAHVSRFPDGLSKVQVVRHASIHFAQECGQSAADAALRMEPSRARNEALSNIAETWARSDTRAAFEWASNLPDGILKEAALRNIYFVWTRVDPATASQILPELPDGDMKDALTTNIAANWAQEDAEAAIAWANARTDPELKATALVSVIESWANSDPRAAAHHASRLLPFDLRQRAVVAALGRWATDDPVSAFEWVSKSSDRSFHHEGIAQVIRVSAPVLPNEASQWVEDLPIGPIRDRGIKSYVNSVYEWNPAAAAQLALLVQDPTLQKTLVEQSLSIWKQWDPDNALQWLASAELQPGAPPPTAAKPPSS